MSAKHLLLAGGARLRRGAALSSGIRKGRAGFDLPRGPSGSRSAGATQRLLHGKRNIGQAAFGKMLNNWDEPGNQHPQHYIRAERGDNMLFVPNGAETIRRSIGRTGNRRIFTLVGDHAGSPFTEWNIAARKNRTRRRNLPRDTPVFRIVLSCSCITTRNRR